MGTLTSGKHGSNGRRKRIWVQQVAVETDKLEMRVQAARSRGTLTDSQDVVAAGVIDMARKAKAAALRQDPIPGRFWNWWRGTLVEAAYREMHTARAQMVDLYDESELIAEVPHVVARANATMHRDDPRRLTVKELLACSPEVRRARVRRMVGDSYEELDLEHAQLRSFRNIVLGSALLLLVIVVGTLVVVAINPSLMPLCFQGTIHACPTSQGPLSHPQSADILVVGVLGALGGALAATLSIRNLKGTSTPYDVPVALAMLKVPMGALTAILGLVAIQGDFVPGLTELDSQGQILAYALVFGFAQQALSRLLDKQAQSLLEGLPGGTAVEPLPGAKEDIAPPKETAVTPAPPGSEEVGAGPDGTPGVPNSTAGTPPADELEDDGPDVVPTPGAALDRPVEEPATATQQEQIDLLTESGNGLKDMTEEEEAELLEAEFGPPDAAGIYGAPPASDDSDDPGEGDAAAAPAPPTPVTPLTPVTPPAPTAPANPPACGRPDPRRCVMSGLEEMVRQAERSLGTTGRPNPITRWYAQRNGSGFANAPWCNMSVTYWANRSGNVDAVCFGHDYAYTIWHAQRFRTEGQWHVDIAGIRRGDIVFFDWDETNRIGRIDHIGLVTGVRDGVVYTIEGNTRNGCRRRARYASNIVGYGRPEYRGGTAAKASSNRTFVIGRSDLAPPGVPTLHRGSAGVLVKQLQSCLNTVQHSGLAVDGRFGPLTTGAVKTFQTRTKCLVVDGRYGPKTSGKLKAARSKVH